MKTRYVSMFAAVLLVVGLVSAAVAQPRTIDPTRFEEAILAFEAEAKASIPPEGAILVTGSSSILRWSSMEADLAPLTVIPRGFGGSAMADVLHYVDRLIMPYKPRAVVIYEGDNDTGMFGVPPMKIAGELKQIIGTIHQALPETRIYVMSVKPSLARVENWDKAQETNDLYRQIVDSDDTVRYIDVATPFLRADGTVMDDIFVDDGLHLNEKGTRIWASTIRAVLMAGEAQYESTNE